MSFTTERAVRSDRFLSWDTFKEQVLPVRADAAPVNSFLRMCFTFDLLRRNADARFLKSLLLPEHADSFRPFVKSYARMLPAVGQLLSDGYAGSLLSPRLREDLEIVNREYRHFLEVHNLFEPLQELSRAEVRQKAILFFPDVILDFPEYRGLLEESSVELQRLPESPGTTVFTYTNARVEVKQACLACRHLLDSGVVPDSIAITLANTTGYADELRDQAACYDIPLVRRIGKPLSDYAEVRIYRLLADCVASGFSIDTLKELFLNTAYPWRNREAGRGLISFGIENYGIRNSRSRGVEVDEWARRLRGAGREELLDYYNRLRRSAQAVTGASTFPDLRTAVMAFNNQFLDTSRFSQQQSLPYSAALDLLSGIGESAAHIRDIPLDSPFSLWMLQLQDRRYVRQERGDGIQVYDYRVSAGIYPDHHFVLGLSQEAAAVRTQKYRFLPLNMLPEEVRQAGDFTEPYLRLYEHSGREVIFSAALEGFEGAVTAVRSLPSATPEAIPGAYSAELRYWRGSGSFDEPIHRVQRAGLEYIAGTGLANKGVDITAQPVENPELTAGIAERLHAAGDLVISPTNLDIWKHCRFRFLLSRVLRLEEAELATVYTDPRELGILYHRLFAEALRNMRSDGTETRPADPEDPGNPSVESSVPVEDLIRSVASPWLGTRFLAPVRNDILRRADESLHRFLEADRSRFRGSRLHALEDALKVDLAGVVLYGRIDRISERAGRFSVVDYKSRLWKKRSGMYTSAGELYSFQIPVYVLLVESTYGPVAEALYYDIDKAVYADVLGGEKPWFDDEERDDLLRQTRETVSAMSRSIDHSEYRTTAGCDPCEFRPVCREKYRVR